MKKVLLTAAVAALALPAFAQSIYLETDQDSSWGNVNNWSTAAVPVAATAVQIGALPANGGLLGIDVGGPVTVASFTINSNVVGDFTVLPGSDETLQVNGGIINNSASTVTFALPINAGGNASWNGPLVFANNVNIDARTITTTEGVTISPGNNLNFIITNGTTFGSVIGAATVSGVVINVTSNFTFVGGSSFDFTTTNFTGATLGSLPTLTGGLAWNTSQFTSSGILTVVPEPSTWALMLGSVALGVVALRRRGKQA